MYDLIQGSPDIEGWYLDRELMHVKIDTNALRLFGDIPLRHIVPFNLKNPRPVAFQSCFHNIQGTSCIYILS